MGRESKRDDREGKDCVFVEMRLTAVMVSSRLERLFAYDNIFKCIDTFLHTAYIHKDNIYCSAHMDHTTKVLLR